MVVVGSTALKYFDLNRKLPVDVDIWISAEDTTVYKGEYAYYSYNGSDYEGILSTLKEVTPVEKTITVYE